MLIAHAPAFQRRYTMPYDVMALPSLFMLIRYAPAARSVRARFGDSARSAACGKRESACSEVLLPPRRPPARPFRHRLFAHTAINASARSSVRLLRRLPDSVWWSGHHYR